MEKNYSEYWMTFVEKGHIVRKSNAKNRYGERRISFTIEGVDFKLIWVEPKQLKNIMNYYDGGRSNQEWFRLYQVEKIDDADGYKETMYGSDFYNLGRSDIHIMADDGVRHLQSTLATQDE